MLLGYSDVSIISSGECNSRTSYPTFFEMGLITFLEVNNFVLVLIGGEKVNFIIINKRFSQNVHNRVGFAAATLAGDKQAKIFIKKLATASSLCGRFCVIVWNLHFK